jgi:Tol biopolymer transport system component
MPGGTALSVTPASAASSTPRPTITPPAFPYEIGPETIVFVSRRLDLWLIESDGTNPRALTQDRWEDTLPRWSPDGSLIAFLSNRDYNEWRDIWTIDPVSGAYQQVTSNGVDYFSWSPDGTRLAYANDEGVWVVSLDGSAPELIAEDVWAPEWSPDGSILAVIGPVVEMETTSYVEPSLISMDRSEYIPVPWWPGNFPNGSMEWAPDNLTLVLAAYGGHLRSGGVRTLEIVDEESRYVDKLSLLPELSNLSAFTPCWSPDGEWIAFALARPGTYEHDGGIVYYATADLEDVTAITNEEAFASNPDWSSDGSRLVFTVGEGRSMGLYVFDTRSDELCQLPTPSGVHGQPDWHP